MKGNVMSEHTSKGEIPSGAEYATPSEVRIFVNAALAIFAARGNEFQSPQVEGEPFYQLDGIAYDPLLTPHLEPFEKATIDAADLSEVEGPSHVEVSFQIPVYKNQGVRRLHRTLTLWNNGDVDDVTRDYKHEAETLDPEEPTKPASMAREDIHAYFEYVLGKEALRQTFDDMEGLPSVPARISRAELDDISKLLPINHL